MRKVTQIIGLANNILEHQGSAGDQEEEEEEEVIGKISADDAEDGEADTELLGLVLTLLSAILNGMYTPKHAHCKTKNQKQEKKEITNRPLC